MTALRAPRRRQLLVAALLSAAMGAARAAPAVEAETALPRPASLPQAAQTAAAQGDALVLLVSMARCPYCEQVRRSYLLPMAAQGAAVFQIDIGSHRSLVDFDGTTRSHDAVTRARQARFAPTVLFLDPQGREIAERLIGAGLADFYGGLLEQRLQTARARLTAR